MQQENTSDSRMLVESAPSVQPGSQPDHGHPLTPTQSVPVLDRLVLLQKAYLLEQLEREGVGSNLAGDLNKKITAAAKRELQLSAAVAKRIRGDLAQQGYLDETKVGRKISYRITESGRSYLAGLERPVLGGRAQQPIPVDEASIKPEIREGQNAYLLLQLLDADSQALTKGEANRFKNAPQASLGLNPAIGNYRRAKLADQGYIRITRGQRSETYALTSDGLDYLAGVSTHLEHATFKLNGSTLNALVAARESSFERNRPARSSTPERPVPNQSELAEAVLAEFQELRRERHSRSGLVPIHEVRERIAGRFGPAAARHDFLDQVILDLRRQHRLSLEGISDLGDATEQQLNDSIPGISGTLFYLEAPREQRVASESV
jgi:DNA-binding PadR family transcriptional regulator